MQKAQRLSTNGDAHFRAPDSQNRPRVSSELVPQWSISAQGETLHVMAPGPFVLKSFRQQSASHLWAEPIPSPCLHMIVVARALVPELSLDSIDQAALRHGSKDTTDA